MAWAGAVKNMTAPGDRRSVAVAQQLPFRAGAAFVGVHPVGL
jgi:hypothetical protein